MTPGRLARAVRAALFAAVCVLLAATGHVLMSGRPVGGWALGAAFAATAGAAWAVAARERGLCAVTAAAVGVQTVLHSVFSWAQSGGGAAGSGAGVFSGPMVRPAMSHVPDVGLDMGTAGHMGHLAMAHLPAAADAHDMTSLASLPGLPGLPGLSLSSSSGMFAAHLLAALLSGLWLAYGERGAFRLLRALPAGLFRPLALLLGAAPVPVHRPRLRPVRPGDERAPRQPHLAHSLVSRGPPQAVAVV
ncbi:hypothetical protein [Streptomyces sp. NPDC094032]|uniref:hypothetical protein n=1 Tax=Streptomyces sp. NPDC094032 TaxID=3155308 RepID=UPI0033236FC9